jgi:hypothetical protein
MNVTIENFIGIFEDAFSKEYCDSVIAHFDASAEAGLCLSRQQQTDCTSTFKDDLQLYGHDEMSLANTKTLIQGFTQILWGVIYPKYSSAFSILKSYDTHSSYSFKVQKTNIGQGYHLWHAEDSSRDICGRILAWTLYLNDVEEGGETEFLYYPKRVKPKTGTFVIWPAGLTHTHRGNPPLTNTKYIVTGWIEF